MIKSLTLAIGLKFRDYCDVKLTINFAHGDKLIGRFYSIFFFFKRQLTLHLYKHHPNPFLIKERRKSNNLFLRSFFWTLEQPFAILFLSSELKCLPRAWRSQKSVRKHKDPTIGNSFISRSFSLHRILEVVFMYKTFTSMS